MAVLIAFGSLVAVLPVAFSQHYVVLGSRALMFALAGGIANGLGLLAFYRLMAGANDGLWDASSVLTITYVLVPVIATIGFRYFFDEAITTDKLIGLVLASAAIWFLK